MGEFSGKTALVTGGSRGIGRAIAAALAGEGAFVAVNYVADGKAADEVVSKIKKMGCNAMTVHADVAKYGEVKKMRASIEKTAGAVDILVNNAGIHQHLKHWELKPGDWKRVIDVNLTGIFNCCNIFTPPMIEKGWGRIINISSVVAHTGTDHELHYAASKGGTISATRSLALELAPYGVRVNAVAPGYIETDMTRGATAKEKLESLRRIPLGRTGEPGEIADAVLFLCSEKSSYITGEVLNVNGGLAFA